MVNIELRDIKKYLLRWLLPFIIGLLVSSFTLLLLVNPIWGVEQSAYSVLIGLLIVITALAWYVNTKGRLNLSSGLTLLVALVGVWGSILIDYLDGLNSFFPLAYLTVPVIFSSLLLPGFYTIALAVVQFVIIVIMVCNSHVLLTLDWASFLAYMLIIFVLSIVANEVIKYQLRQLKEGSIKDHLTGLFNRRYFDETLESRIKRSTIKGYTFGVILLDIDNFKRYNDNYGHGTGDLLLSLVGQFLLDEVTLNDIVCRYGGDEFALIIPHTTPKDLYNLAEKLRLEIRRTESTQLELKFKAITISIGLALFPIHGSTGVDLMAHADENLLQAKEQGKDKVSFSGVSYS